MKVLTPSNAKYGAELSGFFSEVSGYTVSSITHLTNTHTADKSMSILLGRPIALRDEDCTVHFPKELDDDW